MKTFLTHSSFLRAVYIIHHSNYSHPSLEVVHLFLSQKEWQSSIHIQLHCIYFDRRTCSHPFIAWVILSAVVCLFPKKVGSGYAFFQKYDNHFQRILAVIHIFNGTVPFSYFQICSHPILPTHFLSAYFRTQTNVKHLVEVAAIFSEQHQLY